MIAQALQLVFVLVAKGIVLIRPLLPTVCLVLAWWITALVVWTLVAAVRSSVANVRQMHRIPCAQCRYATRDYHLKCPVRPVEAFSEQAIDCPDFASAESYGFQQMQPSSESAPSRYR